MLTWLQNRDLPNTVPSKAHPLVQQPPTNRAPTKVENLHVEKQRVKNESKTSRKRVENESKTSRKRVKIESRPQFRAVLGGSGKMSQKRAKNESKTSPQKGHVGWGRSLWQELRWGKKVHGELNKGRARAQKRKFLLGARSCQGRCAGRQCLLWTSMFF